MVTWNCYQGTDRKVPAMLDRLHPDIAVVPESSRQPEIAANSLIAAAIPHAWSGELPSKGLGIYAPGADCLTAIAPQQASGAGHALAVRTRMDEALVTVLGIWTVPYSAGSWATGYMNSFAQILSDFDDLLVGGETIVAGDFNCSAQSSPEAFAQLLEMVHDRYGLRSAYHTFHGLEPGHEKSMTLWWRGDESRGYHCDLVLVPETWRVNDIVVGTYAEWGQRGLPVSSDHAPVMADLTRINGAGSEVRPEKA